MANTLLIAKKVTEQAVTEGRGRLTEQELSFIGSCYAGAIAKGREENHPTAVAADGNGNVQLVAAPEFLIDTYHHGRTAHPTRPAQLGSVTPPHRMD